MHVATFQGLITLRACARARVVSTLSLLSFTQKLPNLEIEASERGVSETNLSNMAKDWPRYA